MTGLADKRRWVNISKLDQGIMNPKQAAYQIVIPGAFVEGAHFEPQVKNCPWFRETTQHLTPKELALFIKDETDVELLKNMATVEHYTGKREAVIKMLDDRVKFLIEGKSGNSSN